jgi:methyl-accepting chemotaxis protein
MDLIMKISRSGTEKVDKNLSQAADTQKVFESISAGLVQSNHTIEHINTSVSGIVSAGTGVKTNMNVIENMSNTMAARLDEIASSISELQQQGENLSKMANDLRGMASGQNLVFSQLSVN